MTSDTAAAKIVVRNTLVMMGAQTILRVVMVAFAAYVTRQLGSVGYGQYALVTTIANLFSLPADLGLHLYAVRQIARAREQAAHFMSNVAAIRMLVALPVTVLATLMTYFLNYDPLVVVGVAIAGSGLLLMAIQAALDAVLLGYERADYAAYTGVVGQLVFMGVSVLLLQARAHFLVIVAASFLGMVTTSLLSYAVVRRRVGRIRLDLAPATWRPMICAALPIGLLQLFISISQRADTFLLKHWQGDAVVGWYNAAYDILFGLSLLVSSSITLAVYATVSHLAPHQPAQAQRLGQSAVTYLLFFALPCAVGGLFVGDALIALLYGPSFAPGGLLLRLLLCALPVRFLLTFCNHLSIALERVAPALWVALGDLVINVTLNSVLIPVYGAPAAVWTMLIGKTLALGALLWALRDQALLADWRKRAGRQAAALLGMTMFLGLTPALPFLVRAGVGGAVYGAILLLTQAIHLTEIRRLTYRETG